MNREYYARAGRFLATLGVGLWVGGMGFFGAMAAPVLFRTAREHHVPELAPIMVGLMLSRFSILTYLCSFFLLLGWLVDGLVSGDRRLTWKLQGAGSVIALLMALYLGRVLLPQTIAQQDEILPIFARAERKEPLTAEETALRAKFDAGHKTYQKIASANLWLLLGILGLLVARTSVLVPKSGATFATREE